MKIYIATKFQRAAVAKAVCELLEALGYVCTFKWWETTDADKGGKPEHEHTPEELDAIGQRTRQAILDADAVLYLGGAGPSYGAMVEVGMAYAFGKPLALVEPSYQNQKALALSPFFATNPGLSAAAQRLHSDSLAEVNDALAQKTRSPANAIHPEEFESFCTRFALLAAGELRVLFHQ